MASAAMIGLTAAVATPNKVEAHSNGWWIPGAIIGSLALGAIASGAYRPYYGYGYDPYYYGGGPYYYGGGDFPYKVAGKPTVGGLVASGKESPRPEFGNSTARCAKILCAFSDIPISGETNRRLGLITLRGRLGSGDSNQL